MGFEINGQVQPIQAVLEWTDEEYKKNLRFIGNQYNTSLNNVPLVSNGQYMGNGSLSYIAEYMDNLSYIYGSQVPSDYNFFTLDANGNKTAANLVRGLDVKKVYDYLYGESLNIIDPLPKILNVTAYSVGAISARKSAMDYVKFQIDNKVFLNLLQQEAGYQFKAVNEDFETQDQVDKFFTSFQESMEIGFEQIAKHATYNNDYQVLLPKAFGYMLIANLGRICVEYINGEVVWRIVPPENSVVDFSKGLDVHLNDDFGGEVYQLTIPELFTSFDWEPEEQAELIAISNNDNSVYANYYSMVCSNGLNWWANPNNVRKVTVVKGQWVSLEFQDGEWKECLREGVLVGNKFLRNCKISGGQVWKRGNKGKKRLRYITVTPNLFMGTNMSVVGIIKRFANLKDAFITKMVQMASSSFGRSVVIRASKLPEGMRTPDVVAQLKQNNILVIEGEETEDNPNNRNLAETVDLTMDPSITYVLQIIQYLDMAINDYLNIPNSVRGMSQEYQSGKGIESTKAASTKGLSYLFKNFELFMKELLSYSADLMKLMAPDDELGRENLALQVGDSVTELLSMDVVKNMQFEDMLLTINPNDYNSAQMKENLSNLVLQTATSGMPTKVIKNYLVVTRAESLTEAENEIDAIIYKEEKAEAEKLAVDREIAMAQNQANNATQERMTQTTAQAGLEKTAMDNETKLLDTMLKGGQKEKKPLKTPK